MTRTGKIARLPRNIRDTLNTRLDNGEQATDLVRWLNGLPEVQSLLASDFQGRPINTPNLSAWKAGGFLDWQRRQDSCGLIRDIVETADDFDDAADHHQIPDRLAPILAAELARATRRLLDTASDPEKHWRYLCQALRQLNTLRQGDRFAARAALERLHLQIESDRCAEEQRIKENQRLREQATRPIFDALKRKTIISAFGGGETAEKVADHFQHVDEILRDPSDHLTPEIPDAPQPARHRVHAEGPEPVEAEPAPERELEPSAASPLPE